MIEKLEQLTMSRFIDMVCGKTDVLHSKHEVCTPAKIAIVVRNIVLEYRAIADPGGNNAYFRHVEEWLKAKIRVIIFTMCNNLVLLKQYEKVREIFDSFGLSGNMTDSKLAAIVKSKLAVAERELTDFESEKEKMTVEQDNIRAQFDTQIASLMAHFKFQIDVEKIRATIYANLVARYNREIKKLSSVKK